MRWAAADEASLVARRSPPAVLPWFLTGPGAGDPCFRRIPLMELSRMGVGE